MAEQKICPVEPTREIIDAGMLAGFFESSVRKLWKAMLAHCPSAPANGEADEGHYAYLKAVIDIVNEFDCHDDIHWNEHDDGKAYAWVICNDLFWWGTADGEEILPNDIESLKQAYRDAGIDGGILWCARKRKLRPQGAYYKHLTKVAHLFDACGPERPTDFGNPQDQATAIAAIAKEAK